MIPVFLRAMAPRLLLVALAGVMFYLMEPGFHQHGSEGAVTPDTFDLELGPLGVAATLANLSGVAMLVLLGGFISTDRRRGYYRMYFSHPTRPVFFYLLRWMLALALAMLSAAAFLVVGQLAAWGEFRGGWEGLLLALLSAIAYGGVVAFLSAVVPRGDAWVAVVLFLFTFFWLTAVNDGIEIFTPGIRQAISLLLPPQLPLQGVYDGLLRGEVAGVAAAFSAGYGIFWLALAMLVVRFREWP